MLSEVATILHVDKETGYGKVLLWFHYTAYPKRNGLCIGIFIHLTALKKAIEGKAV